MNPPPPNDELEPQQALRLLSVQIGEAVAKADANRIRDLSTSRRALLQKTRCPDGSVRFSDSLRAELIRESEEWVATMYEHQTRISAAIERLRSRRNTRRILTRAYQATPSTVAQCFTHRG